MSLVESEEVVDIIQRTLNYVDPRLVEHGERVAYLVLRLLEVEGKRDAREIRDMCMVTLLHDIGAYKTEEIDRMLQFESQDVWHHSIYGYLFLKHLSPLGELASAVLFHHLDERKLIQVETKRKTEAQLIFLADRIDTYIVGRHMPPPRSMLERQRGQRFSEEVVELLHTAEGCNPDLYYALLDGSYKQAVERCIRATPFQEDEINAYLRMVVSSIDFRSYHTVTHTITTERISEALAVRMDLTEEEQYKVKYGALLHDLGKIAIPVEILEFPGKLSPQAMQVMRTHVQMTEEILGESADPAMLRISVRHHEKLDGSGYPRGLTGSQLTYSERIVAVADIVSALSGTRSYKGAFDEDRIVGILSKMKAEGQLCPAVVDTMLGDYDGIMEEVRVCCAPVLESYASIQDEFQALNQKCAVLDAI